MTRRRRQEERPRNVVLTLNGRNTEDVPLLVIIENVLVESVRDNKKKLLKEFERQLIYTRTIEKAVPERIPTDFVFVGSVGMFIIYYSDGRHEALVLI